LQLFLVDSAQSLLTGRFSADIYPALVYQELPRQGSHGSIGFGRATDWPIAGSHVASSRGRRAKHFKQQAAESQLPNIKGAFSAVRDVSPGVTRFRNWKTAEAMFRREVYLSKKRDPLQWRSILKEGVSR
jgi:hypothetical protein